MVPLVLLVHPDPPWSTFSVKFEKSLDQNGSEWTTLQHFPDVFQAVYKMILPLAILEIV